LRSKFASFSWGEYHPLISLKFDTLIGFFTTSSCKLSEQLTGCLLLTGTKCVDFYFLNKKVKKGQYGAEKVKKIKIDINFYKVDLDKVKIACIMWSTLEKRTKF